VTERALLAKWRDALRDSQLDKTAKTVGYVIATYWNSRGLSAFPAKKTIAAGASVSKRTADAAVDRLELAGFLEVSRSRGRLSNRYAATLPTVQGAAPLTLQLAAPLDDANRATDDSQPCNGRHSTVQWAAPESGKAKAKKNALRAARENGKQNRANARTENSIYDEQGL
jgi:DNA-binding MarR family transcriptional regulator